jgi:hypothetical protein
MELINISANLKGRKLTIEHKKNISKGGKGRIPWNKGKTGVQDYSYRSL